MTLILTYTEGFLGKHTFVGDEGKRVNICYKERNKERNKNYVEMAGHRTSRIQNTKRSGKFLHF